METGGGGAAPFVVVGGGMAGARAASTLARQTHEPVILVCRERYLPYNRPALSKEFLRGETSEDEITLYGRSQLERLGVEVILGAEACGLDADRRVVELEGGEELAYKELLVATGRRARRLEAPGQGVAGVLTLRELEDARRIRDSFGHNTELVVVGGGFIGLEVAAAARARSVRVSVVDVDPVPFGSRLGDVMGRRIQDLHRRRGVEFHMGVAPVEFVGTRVLEGVMLSNNKVLSADLVVVGVGSEPATEWMGAFPLAEDATIEVDASGRSAIGAVWACGDVCSSQHPYFGRLRVEHETTAQFQARQVAMAMAGRRSSIESIPFAWSHQYDHRLEVVGVLDCPGCEVDVTDAGSAGIVAVYRRGREVHGVATIDLPSVSSRVLQLMQHELPPDAGAVAEVVNEGVKESLSRPQLSTAGGL